MYTRKESDNWQILKVILCPSRGELEEEEEDEVDHRFPSFILSLRVRSVH